MTPTRIGVLGVGAIGGVIAARLARAGHAVNVVARGSHLAAMARDGLHLSAPDGDFHAPVEAVADAGDLPPVDVLFLCVKAPDLTKAAAQLGATLIDKAIIVPVLNGIPWWYGTPLPVRAVDLDGALAARFASARLVGAVAHFAAEVPGPGAVRQTSTGRLLLGHVQGPAGDAARAAALLSEAGLEARAVPDIGREVWIKLAGNVAFNPISALTGATLSEICASDELLAVVRQAMGECMAVGTRCGIDFPMTIDGRIDAARRIGGSKLSMLQDLERGRGIEAAALMGAVMELGNRAGVPTPTVEMLHALVSARARHPFERI
ncbi:MAG: 2-dehydropantoate 2-reductase [bacterium]|nr:2-dehydropantoate 2-reductase [bacterium]